jgi:hypothetical protein
MKKDDYLEGDHSIHERFSQQTIRFWHDSMQKKANDSLSEEEAQINTETQED